MRGGGAQRPVMRNKAAAHWPVARRNLLVTTEEKSAEKQQPSIPTLCLENRITKTIYTRTKAYRYFKKTVPHRKQSESKQYAPK